MCRLRQSVDDAEHHLAQDDDGDRCETLDQRIGGSHASAQADAGAPKEQQQEHPGSGEDRPYHEPQLRRQEGTDEDHDDRNRHRCDVTPGVSQELRMHAGVLQPDLVPEPGHYDQECRVSDREAPASAACVGRVRGEDGENADLKEEIRARPPVKSAMQLEI